MEWGVDWEKNMEQIAREKEKMRELWKGRYQHGKKKHLWFVG